MFTQLSKADRSPRAQRHRRRRRAGLTMLLALTSSGIALAGAESSNMVVIEQDDSGEICSYPLSDVAPL